MEPLAKLGRALRDAGYAFITPTPATHQRILARGGQARTLRDVFGWSRPFPPQLLPEMQLALLEEAGALERAGLLLRSRVRFSSLGPLLLANPPYLADDAGRTYRDGGGALGTGLSVRIVREALDRLRPGGRLLLYTATPVIEGEHVLWPQLEPLLCGLRHDYLELDPDVFGEEL